MSVSSDQGRQVLGDRHQFWQWQGMSVKQQQKGRGGPAVSGLGSSGSRGSQGGGGLNTPHLWPNHGRKFLYYRSHFFAASC